MNPCPLAKTGCANGGKNRRRAQRSEPRETVYFFRSALRGWPLRLARGMEAEWPQAAFNGVECGLRQPAPKGCADTDKASRGALENNNYAKLYYAFLHFIEVQNCNLFEKMLFCTV